MLSTTSPARRSSRARNPHNGHHHRNDFARQAVFAEFGKRHAKAIDQIAFIDRRPDQTPRRIDSRPAREMA